MRVSYTISKYVLATHAYNPPTIASDLLLIRPGDRKDPSVPEDNGWRVTTTGRFERLVVPGDHLSMARQPEDVAVLARELAARVHSLRTATARSD
jgi:thioesterase domain-containing protein